MKKEKEEEEVRGRKREEALYQEIARGELSLRSRRGEVRGRPERGGSQKPSGRKSSPTSSTLRHLLPQLQKWRSLVEPRPPVLSIVKVAVQSTQGEHRFLRVAIGARRASARLDRARGRRRATAVDLNLIRRPLLPRTASLAVSR